MHLPELLQSTKIALPNLAPFLRTNLRAKMPPLDTTKLAIDALVAEERAGLRTPITGLATLLMMYKGHEGAVLSLDETANGEIWDIKQVQGAKSSVSYRVASTLKWPQLLGTRVGQFATHTNAEVRQVVMKPTHLITNIEEAKSDRIEETYKLVRDTLGMRWSKEQGVFVRDI